MVGRAVALANQSSTDPDLSVARRLACHAVLSRRSFSEGGTLNYQLALISVSYSSSVVGVE